ncbi:nuclease PIN [Salmonella enterica subsp. enterica serovar Richmond]|nr:nuclease PIN [Salmonella enterica]EBR9918838.1 nuclease PIN [Salmonella enterica subsp. enterica serovar Richmond]EBV8115672.1 nuclease PIN [Salmonella enterica subsp. enterica serovar Baildon]ECY4325424.1 nuclease PIN [Salmonella enterica subsp. enterica serovar Enteritidis]EEA9092002.1 nuclease PIN [Salmonella enterica subsp. enterica]EIC4014501.1 nuclease PIN [Salmonella enterica subsp. enterica serovar Amager]
MKKVTIALSLIALVLSAAMNSVLYAGELLSRDEFYLADEEHYGRTGVLEVRGALLSSPCTLITNELKLPLQGYDQGRSERYPLQVALTGCGDGEDVTSAFTPAGRSSVMVVYSALLSGMENGVLHPGQRMVGAGRATLHGGSSQMTWYLTEEQQMALQRSTNGQVAAPFNSPASGSLLRLRMDYE